MTVRGEARLAVRPLAALSATVAVLVLAPVGGLVFFAARGSGDLWPHLFANVLPAALRTTLALLLGVGVVVAVVGVGAAWLVAMCRFPGRRWLEWALLLPLSIPTYIGAYAYLDVLHPVGPVQTGLRAIFGLTDPRALWFPEIRSLPGAILVLGAVLYPYVYLPTRALFLMESASMVDAARSLGASRWRAFLRVAMPLSRPAVAAGMSLALLETLNDIGASSFLGVNTLTVSIYTTWTARSSIEGAAQIALVMLVVASALILLERRARHGKRFAAGGDAPPSARVPLSGVAGAGAAAFCALPVFVGFAVPASYLVVQAWRRVSVFGLPEELGRWIANTVLLASIATGIAVAIALVLVYAARPLAGTGGGWRAAVPRIASLGYAMPGTVLAVGLLVPVAALDNLVDDAMRSLFGLSTGLLLSGSGAAVIFAYVLRFLAIPIGTIEAGFAKIDPAIELSARSLGAGARRILLRIHAPLLRPAILAGALLVFVDCMKELPATLLLRPFDFETLATFIYAEAARGTYEDGAIAALAIVAVSLLPVAVVGLSGRREQSAPAFPVQPAVAVGPA